MIRLNRNILDQLRKARYPEEVFGYVQDAIRIEHATIPPYLTALYSLKPGTNQDVADILGSIVRDEMLHMTIVSNLLIAIGGSPRFATESFVPKYPDHLAKDVAGDIMVGLGPCSMSLVYDTFMRIEQPKQPLPLRLKNGGSSYYPEATGTYATLGDFYKELLQSLQNMSIDWRPASAQVTPETTGTTWYSPEDLFPITSFDDATRAIDLIVTEGEGADGPLDEDGRPAHFYRFGEIYYGARLVKDASKRAENGGIWSYTGPDVTFDPSGVFDMQPNAKASMYEPGTELRNLVDRFNQAYMQLLLGLDNVFGGHPERLRQALGLMFQLRIFAFEALNPSVVVQSGQPKPGLTFEYVPAVVS